MPENKNKNIPSSGEAPTKKFLAEEAKDLLLYAAQSSPKDVAYFYGGGIDIEKIIAFLEIEDLSRLPAILAKEIMEDDRREVINALAGKMPELKEAVFFATLEDWGSSEGITVEQIAERGRGAIGRALRRVSGNRRELRREEIEAIASIVSTIDDPTVIDEIMSFAQEYYDIAKELIFNDGIKIKQIETLIDSSMEKTKTSWKWTILLEEIYIKFSKVLDEEYMNKLRKLPNIKIIEDSENKIETKKSAKKRKSTRSRREERLEEKEKKRLRQSGPPTMAKEDEKAA